MTVDILIFILFPILAYLLGSISSAIIICRLSGLPDPRSQGSKNPGTTNVLRLGGKKLAALTLLGDVLKGFIAVKLAIWLYPNPILIGIVIIAVFLGHLYPIFFNFKGGKGVATAFGAILGLSWPIAAILIGVWMLIAFLFRFSSLAALVAALLAPILVALFLNFQYVIPMIIVTLLLFWRHRNNIQRLIKGVEPKIGEKKTTPI